MQQDVVEPHFALLTPLNAVFLLRLHALHPKKKKKKCVGWQHPQAPPPAIHSASPPPSL